MENRIKRVRIVGKGHASCFERLLLEWYRRESFVDVILTCVGSPENHLSDEAVARHIPANRSVLAAASPVFAAMFCENPLVEEDVRISVVGYSYTSIRSIIEYIYTGSLEFSDCDKEQIKEILRDFLIPIPNTKKISKNQEKETVTDDETCESIVESRSQIITETGAENRRNTTYDTNTGIRNEEAEEHGIHIVSSVSLSSMGDVQIIPPTKTYRANKMRPLAPKAFTRAVKNPELASAYSRKNALRPRNKVNPHDAEESPPVLGNITTRVCDFQKLPTALESTIQKPLNAHINPRNCNLPLSEPVINQVEATTTPQLNVIRIFNRMVEAPHSSKKQTTMESLPIPFCQFGLSKSFDEKTVIQSESVLVPPVKVDIPIMKNGRCIFTVTEEMARASYYRNVISALYDVPGTYTLYRERPTPNIDTIPFCELAKFQVSKTHIFVPSYLEKKPLFTYQDRPSTRAQRQSQTSISLSGFRIESVHQVNGKVHICTLGEPLVNQASETLFEDYPLSYLNPDQVVSRLSLEHNYSFGETPLPTDSECSNRSELAKDLEDYKSAIQLAINQQRRKNRLRHRIQSYSKEVSTLKRRAVELLDICHLMQDEAHEMDPDYQRSNKKTTSERSKIGQSNDADEKVPCTVCNKLIKKTWLKQHMVILHTEERNHLCDECGRTFVIKAQLRAHQLRQHKAVPGNHLCEQCGRSFRFARYLNRHMSLHSSEKPHVCRYCDKAFRLKPVLIKHIRTHTGEKPYKCTVCGRCFRQRTTYATHLKMHEKRQMAGVREGNTGLGQLPRLKCDFCSMTFKLDLFLMLHRAKHTGETPALPCPTCKDTFPSIKELTLHRKSQHPESVYACQICPKVFTNKANFDFHVHKHSNPDAVKKKYPKVDPVDTGPCTCDFCDKVFKSRSARDYHIKGIHLGDKSLKCQYCDKTFSHKPSLEQHMRTHTGERPFKCDQCPSSFKQQQHLTAHMVVHTGERPFSCDHCDKTFPHKTSLYAHLRIHTGKRLMCTHCRKVLPSLAQLMRHEENCSLNTNESSVE
uniref:Zinc finger protein n=1 Tax=Daphnia magna TaxID=35525 RepID=A0A0P4ZLW2_9CRUS